MANHKKTIIMNILIGKITFKNIILGNQMRKNEMSFLCSFARRRLGLKKKLSTVSKVPMNLSDTYNPKKKGKSWINQKYLFSLVVFQR